MVVASGERGSQILEKCEPILQKYVREFCQSRSMLTRTHSVARLFFDILCGIDRADVPMVIALESAIFLGYDGQLEQKSGIETGLFRSVIEQLKQTEMTNTENALMWLYVKTWGHKGQHILDDASLWNFGSEDLEVALTKTSYPKKKHSAERIGDLTKLITEVGFPIDALS